MQKCDKCNGECKTMPAVGAWPRCQHRIEGRDFDPYSQCIWKSRHKGCHKAEYPGSVDVWSCVAK